MAGRGEPNDKSRQQHDQQRGRPKSAEVGRHSSQQPAQHGRSQSQLPSQGSHQQGRGLREQVAAGQAQNRANDSRSRSATPRLRQEPNPQGRENDNHAPVNVWETYIEVDTPPYIREQQAKERERQRELNRTPPMRDLSKEKDEAINGRPFVSTPQAGPTDTVDEHGNLVRTYAHCRNPRVSFAPSPDRQRSPGPPGSSMAHPRRRPTPFPQTPRNERPDTAMPDVDIQRRPTPFPELRPRPLGPYGRDMMRNPERARYEAEQRRSMVQPRTTDTPYPHQGQQYGYGQPNRPQHRPQSRGPPHYGGQQPMYPPRMPQPQDYHWDRTRNPQGPPVQYGREPPYNGHGHPFRQDRSMSPHFPQRGPPNQQYGPPNQQYGPPHQTRNPHNGRYPDLVAEQRGIPPLRQHGRRGMSGTRPVHGHPDPAYHSDDSDSVKREPSDNSRAPDPNATPRRGPLRVRNPDPIAEAQQAELRDRNRPAYILARRGVESDPMYAPASTSRSSRLDQWIANTASAYPEDDYFRQWLRAKEEHDQQNRERNAAQGGGQMGPPHLPGAPRGPGSSAQQPYPDNLPRHQYFPVSENAGDDGRRSSKRGAPHDDNSHEADEESHRRASKRSRLADTFRRKLSLRSSTANRGGTTSPDGGTDVLTVRKRRLSGIDIFNPRSFSSRAFSSLSRASNVGPTRVRIAVIGDSGAGKTTMLNRLYTGMYRPAAKSDFLRNNDFPMTIEGYPIILEAWDIPGEHAADETHPLHRSFFDAVLICFSVDDVANVSRAPHWVNVLQSCLIVDIPVYLVGLKSDARPAFPMLRLGFMFEATPTTREQCEIEAQKIGAEYFECSAKTGEGVTELFHAVIEQAREKKDDDELKRASRLRRERLRKGVQETGRRFSSLFCVDPGMEL